jgi:hypothetical protein
MYNSEAQWFRGHPGRTLSAIFWVTATAEGRQSGGPPADHTPLSTQNLTAGDLKQSVTSEIRPTTVPRRACLNHAGSLGYEGRKQGSTKVGLSSPSFGLSRSRTLIGRVQPSLDRTSLRNQALVNAINKPY